MKARLDGLGGLRECRAKIWAYTATASWLVDRQKFMQTVWRELPFSVESVYIDVIQDEIRKALGRTSKL